MKREETRSEEVCIEEEKQEKQEKQEKDEEDIVEFFRREEIEQQKQKFAHVSPTLKIPKIFFVFFCS